MRVGERELAAQVLQYRVGFRVRLLGLIDDLTTLEVCRVSGRSSCSLLLFPGPEAIAVVAGLNDVAAVGEPIEKSRGHLGVAKDVAPFPERHVGRERSARHARTVC